MKHTIIVLLALACLTTPVTAETPREAFVKAWKGQSVVIKTALAWSTTNAAGWATRGVAGVS